MYCTQGPPKQNLRQHCWHCTVSAAESGSMREKLAVRRSAIVSAWYWWSSGQDTGTDSLGDPGSTPGQSQLFRHNTWQLTNCEQEAGLWDNVNVNCCCNICNNVVAIGRGLIDRTYGGGLLRGQQIYNMTQTHDPIWQDLLDSVWLKEVSLWDTAHKRWWKTSDAPAK